MEALGDVRQLCWFRQRGVFLTRRRHRGGAVVAHGGCTPEEGVAATRGGGTAKEELLLGEVGGFVFCWFPHIIERLANVSGQNLLPLGLVSVDFFVRWLVR